MSDAGTQTESVTLHSFSRGSSSDSHVYDYSDQDGQGDERSVYEDVADADKTNLNGNSRSITSSLSSEARKDGESPSSPVDNIVKPVDEQTANGALEVTTSVDNMTKRVLPPLPPRNLPPNSVGFEDVNL